tara:strand:+ start:1361 stop:1879 length:519 start_codon:yes stop_codon:yes gene_type:complete
MAAVDISPIGALAPVAAFLIVVAVSFSVFIKTKLMGDNAWVQLFVSFVIGALFVGAAGAVQLVQTIVPWFAVLLVSFFLLLALMGFLGKDMNFASKGAGVVFIVLLGIVFLFSAFSVYSNTLVNYLPGPGFGAGGDEGVLFFLDWLYSPRVLGTVILVLVSAVASWVLVKGK